MKKLISAVSFAMIFSTGVMAEAIPSGTAITNTDCSLLGTSVTVNLSKGVNGSYVCDEAGQTVTIAACNENGSRAAKTLNCVNYESDSTATPRWNDASCATTGTTSFEGIGYTGYKAVSSGGGVGGNALTANCNADSIEELANRT